MFLPSNTYMIYTITNFSILASLSFLINTFVAYVSYTCFMFFFFFLNFSCNFVKFLVWYFSVHVPYVINELILSCNKMKEKIIKKLKKKSASKCKRVASLKGAMSPHTHARANENKLEKVGPSFSSSVGDFKRLFSSV